jgi:hypothetical protein
MEQMEQGMAEIFYDAGCLFLALPNDGVPVSPYWKRFMDIGHRHAELRSDENGNYAFFDEDDALMGIQMEDPIDKHGSPKESVLHWLRQVMEEHQVVWFIETMQSIQQQHAKEGPEDEGEISSLQINPEGLPGAD